MFNKVEDDEYFDGIVCLGLYGFFYMFIGSSKGLPYDLVDIFLQLVHPSVLF